MITSSKKLSPNFTIMEQQPELLPTEWVSDSVGTYLYQKRPKRHVIYTVMLAALLLAKAGRGKPRSYHYYRTFTPYSRGGLVLASTTLR